MSKKKTSTAALDSFRQGSVHNQRRVPRHPAGASWEDMASGVPKSLRKKRALASELRQWTIRIAHQEIQQARLAVVKEDVMNPNTQKRERKAISIVLPVILRITCSLLLWTLGASAMDIRLSQIQSKEHRIVLDFPIDRAKVENLQRWVNDGHDPWCRDPQLVAAATLRRVSPGLAEYGSASLSLELEHSAKNSAVYAFHSFDGRTTYRVTLRRHLYLHPTAGSLRRMIWIPETVEIITRDTQD